MHKRRADAAGRMGALAGLKGLGFTSIHVHRLDAARRFYEDVLGLPVLTTYPGEAVYGLSGATLLIHQDDEGECGRTPGGPTGLYLLVDDLASAKAQLTAQGVPIVHETESELGIEDPDGNGLVLWRPNVPWPPA